jgi:hypothetical protein
MVTGDFVCRAIPKLNAWAGNSSWLPFAGSHTFGEEDEMGAMSTEHSYVRREQPLLELQVANGCTVGAGRSQVTHGQRERAAIGGNARGWIMTDKYDPVLTSLQV